MKRFLDLVKNESLKLWGQTSFRVLAIILAVLLILTPLFNLLMYELLDMLGFGGWSYEDYLDQADTAREAGEELEAREYETLYEAEKYFAELGLDGSSAEYAIYYIDYQELMLARSALEILAEGNFSTEELHDSYYSSIDTIYTFLVGYGFYDDTDSQGYYQYNVISVVKQALEDRDISAWITAIETELANLRFNIENFSMKFYYDQMLAGADEVITYVKADLDEMNSLLEGDLPEEDRAYYESYRSYCEDTIACFEAYKSGVGFLIENNCKYGSWEYTTVAELSYPAASSCNYNYPLTNSEFAEAYYSYQYDSAEEYNKEMEKERLLALEAQDYALHSLENSIPLPKALDTASTKTQITSQFRSFVGMLTVLFICYGGVTMAHEYSSGTIRLLLIKPRSRIRILGSKFVTLAFWWLVAALGSLILLGVGNVLLFGVNDTFVPDLKAMRSGIAEIPSLVSLLGVFGEEFLMAMLYVTFALLFAVLTKKAALSILFPMLVSMGASIIQSIAVALYEAGAVFVAYTPFFYLDFEFLHSTAVDRFMYGSDLTDIVGSVISMASTNILLGKHASILIGILMLALLTAAFSAISFAVFKKQKI